MNFLRMNPMKNIAPGLLVIVFALTSFAAEGNNVSYKSGGETVQGMLYTRRGRDHFPPSSSSTNIGDSTNG